MRENTDYLKAGTLWIGIFVTYCCPFLVGLVFITQGETANRIFMTYEMLTDDEKKAFNATTIIAGIQCFFIWINQFNPLLKLKYNHIIPNYTAFVIGNHIRNIALVVMPIISWIAIPILWEKDNFTNVFILAYLLSHALLFLAALASTLNPLIRRLCCG